MLDLKFSKKNLPSSRGNLCVWLCECACTCACICVHIHAPPLSWHSSGVTGVSPALAHLPLSRSLELPGQHSPVSRSRAAGAAHNWLFLPEAWVKIPVPTFPQILTLGALCLIWRCWVWCGLSTDQAKLWEGQLLESNLLYFWLNLI